MGEPEETPRSARELIADSFRLYRRHPLLFLVLAVAVLGPCDLVVLAVTGGGPVTAQRTDFGTELLILGLSLFLVLSVVSALTVHAVALERDGAEPGLWAVLKRAVPVLPVVVAATIIAQLGTILGSLLIVPGVILYLRLSVVAQVAAIEHEGWIPALQRSWALTDSHYRHVLAFLALMLLVSGAVPFVIGLALYDHPTTPLNFAGGLAVQTLATSFGALATALFYYDLRLRGQLLAAEAPLRVTRLSPGRRVPEDPGPSGPSTVAADAKQSSWDPRVYTDPERPTGWYVVPARPHRMRYWIAGEEPAWHPQSARTPREVREDWEREVGLRGPA